MVASMNRPVTRRFTRILDSARRGLSRAASLFSRAGLADRPEFEHLENRQMLFALTITPGLVNPATGVGTIVAYFGYAIPYLAPTAEVGEGTQRNVTEDFNQNNPGVPGTAAATVLSGYVWPQSNFRVEHNLPVAPPALAGMRLIQPDPSQQNENSIQVRMTSGQSFTLSQTVFNVPLDMLQMTLRNFSTSFITVELWFDGELVEDFTGEALAALGTPIPNEPGAVRYSFARSNGQVFDQIRFRANAGAPDLTFTFDDLNAVIPGRRFDNILGRRLFGVSVAFTGPVGATAEFFDLHDRPMRRTIAVGQPPMTEILLIDPDGDGIPNFNDGIGRIVLSNVNHRSAITMWGGVLGSSPTPPPDADFIEGPFFFRFQNQIVGLFNEFEQAGFGYAGRLQNGQWTVTGLPTGIGSVIVGSPFLRPLDDYRVGGLAPGTGTTVVAGFNRLNQGIFVQGGNNMGSVYLHGILHGHSRFPGFLDRMFVGYLTGSVTVAGDLGYLTVSSDAGMWVDDEGPAPNGAAAVRTNAQLHIGRTLGEMRVVGRNLMNLTVVGDLNAPSSAPGRDVLRYYEREYSTSIFGAGTEIRDIIRNIIANNAAAARNDVLGALGFFFGRIDQATAFGNSFGRNDTILTAEWVGSIGTSVQIHGDLGRRDLINTQADPSDVYGFAVDGTNDILVQFDATRNLGFIGGYIRLVDVDGRTVAAPQRSDDPREVLTIRYRPDGPGVLYLVVHTVWQSATSAFPLDYVLTIAGMAPTTLGLYRTGAGSGNVPGTAATNNITVHSGSIGALIIDSGFQAGGGGPASPTAIINAPEPPAGAEALPWRSLRGSTFSVPGNLYAILAGDDIEGSPAFPVNFNIGGNLGLVRTGLAFPNDPTQGDLRYTLMSIGGSVGMFDIKGGVGINQDVEARPYPVDAEASVIIHTGRNPNLRGDIGFFRVGSFVGGDTVVVNTSNNSIIGGFVVAQDHPYEEADADYGIYRVGGLANGVVFNVGFNSDVRFFDTPRIDLLNVRDHSLPIPVNGAPLLLTDDAGGRVRLRIVGGNGLASGEVRLVPITGFEGVAIGRLDVNLEGGARLEIDSQSAPNQFVVSIGRISIRNSDENSSILITGNTQVDVWRIVDVEGNGLNEIVNRTPFGDIVAIDVQRLNRLELGSGSLGRTQMPVWGPQLIGPFMGIVRDGNEAVEGPFTLPLAAVTGFWTQGLYRPTNESRFGIPPGSWLDDVGSPFDPYLNGLIVREGDLLSVQVGGAVGDVLVPTGTIGNVIANFDGVTPQGRFDGIVGNIHGLRVSRVDIGDGLAPRTQGPLATTGITALDDIGLVIGTRIPGASIMSNIIAANITPGNAEPGTFPINGINRIELRGGGHFVGAWIGATPLDNFWWSYLAPDSGAYNGTVGEIAGIGANLLRSHVQGFNVNTVRLTNGFYDASTMRVSSDLGLVEARGFRNSTIGGGELEFHTNRIIVGGHFNMLTTTGRAGDINDLNVEVIGRLGEVSARNISRTRLDVATEINRLQVGADLRGSEITTGMLTSATVGQNIRSTLISVAGPLIALTVGDSITNTDIRVTGPDGRIDAITVTNLLSGRIRADGPINSIRVTQGDMVAFIQTTVNQRGLAGDVALLQAGRDLDIRTDIAGTIHQMIAGRHIGNQTNPGVILVRGNVQNVSAPNGQLYSDLRIGERLIAATFGRAVHRPGGSNLGLGSIIAFGRIESITINGDFGGDIISYSGGIGVITINDGSLVPGARIAAYDGDLSNLIINNGNLYGDVHADYILWSIRLNGSEDGVFGHIGINPNYSAGTPYSAHRNQHPPGVIANAMVQGPRITAGHNLGRVILTNGSIFESFLYAARAIGTIEVGGDIRNDNMTGGHGTVIAAGSSIFTIRVFGSVWDTMILAGVRDFGANGRPGGTGLNADVVESGRIENIDIRGSASNLLVSAGIDPGPDGMYSTADDLVVMGVSFVRNLTIAGVINNVSVFADSEDVNASPLVIRGGHNLAHRNPDIYKGGPIGIEVPGDGTPVAFSWNNATGTIAFTGPGRVFWDQLTGRLLLIGTTLESQILVTSATSILRDFIITTSDDASVGTVEVQANLFGDSRIVIDGYALSISTWDLNDQSTILVGMNVQTISTGSITGGRVQGMYWVRDIVVQGNFGTTADFDEARILAVASRSITINGHNAALINIDRDLGALTVTGAMDRAQFRSGASVGSLTTGGINQSRVSVRDRLGPVVVNGDLVETAIQAGGDLGSNVLPGVGNATTTGHIESVTVNGRLIRSSIVAGLIRGPDGYFGTSDDFVAPGRSTMGNVTITGTAEGSNTHSEQFRISATGEMGSVRINGLPGVNQGNFQIDRLPTQPQPIQVIDVFSGISSMVWTTWIYFNQAMNQSTIGPALTVAEVRRDPEQGILEIPLIEGVDYTLGAYDRELNRIGVIFKREVTERNLDDETGLPGDLPGPGVYRFRLDAEVLRASVVNARLAANLEGFGNTMRDFSADVIVGDPGDKLTSGIAFDDDHRVDFYGPVDLDLVLDNNYSPDGLPDTNNVYTLRGFLGDHPDHGGTFRPAGDTDIFKITLRAGQILRLGAMEGAALFASRMLLNSDGEVLWFNTDDALELPKDPLDLLDRTEEDHFLIKKTGTYYIIITNTDFWDDPEFIPSVTPASGTVGDYMFTVEVYDDLNSGFAADTESGNGTAVVNAPHPIVFAGPSGVFGTEDDRSEVVIGDFVFRLDPGADGIRGTADDIVTGSNSAGIVSTRVGDQLTSTVEASIGPRGFAGVPSRATPDVDIFHLNNRQPIAPGQLIAVTVKLAEMGADLGSFSSVVGSDFRGDVQFALFDTTDATDIDDALLIFSPKDFKPIASEPGQIAAQGPVVYGYDSNGDFFIRFITPGKINGDPNEPASYAIYIQGVFNTDYRLEIQQTDTPQGLGLPRASQNVFIELNGGFVDWLEAGGLRTQLDPFASAVLGFTGGMPDGRTVDKYIMDNVLQSLRSIFDATGVTFNISTNPNDFEFQDFSKVFITSTTDPITIFNTNNFGYSQRSDPFNTHRNDESVIFLPSFATLGYIPSLSDLDDFVLSLTAAVGRRIGELAGLRMTDFEFTFDREVMSSSSVQFVPFLGGDYAFRNDARRLSDNWDVIDDTNFFLGYQNSLAMLQRYLRP
jgi:hypothetical protein